MKELKELMDGLFQDGQLTVAKAGPTALSCPVPVLVNGVLAERFFLCANLPRAVRRRPYGWITVDSEQGRLLQFSHCSVDDFASELNIPLENEIDYSAPKKAPVRELMQSNRKLGELYGKIREFAFLEEVSKEDQELLNQYKELISQLWGEDIRRFYEALSPEFFSWLSRQTD